MLAKLGNMEDIVNIFESPPEIQPVSSLSNTFQHPKRTYKPSPSQVTCFQREQHFFFPLDAPKVGGACQSSTSSIPGIS